MPDGLCAAAMFGSFAALSDGSPVRKVRLSYQSQLWMSRRFYVKAALKSADVPTYRLYDSFVTLSPHFCGGSQRLLLI